MLKRVKSVRKIAAAILILAAFMCWRYLLEIWWLPEQLDKVFYQASSHVLDMDEIVVELNANSSWEEPRYDRYSDEETVEPVVTGYSFRRESTALIIQHSSMNSWSASRIIDRFQKDALSDRWQLLPVKVREQWTGDTPSWGDRARALSQAGFTTIVLIDGNKRWHFPISGPPE